MRLRLVLLCLISAAVSLPAMTGIANASSWEAEILSLVNDSRSSDLSSHSGLQAAAREHSREMARDNNLNHNGAATRIASSAPAGYTGGWCENVGYVSDSSHVASDIVGGWRDSATHNACMRDGRMNVTGVGTYFDSTRKLWWVTMEYAQTSSGSGTQEPAPKPAAPVSTPRPQVAQPVPRQSAPEPTRTPPKVETEVLSVSEPRPTAEPDPTAKPEPELSRNAAQVLSDAGGTSNTSIAAMLGAREYAVLSALGLFGLMVLFLARRKASSD